MLRVYSLSSQIAIFKINQLLSIFIIAFPNILCKVSLIIEILPDYIKSSFNSFFDSLCTDTEFFSDFLVGQLRCSGMVTELK